MEEKEVLEKSQIDVDNVDKCTENTTSTLLTNERVNLDMPENTDQSQLMMDILVKMNKLTDDVQSLSKKLDESSAFGVQSKGDINAGNNINFTDEDTATQNSNLHTKNKKKTVVSIISNIVFYTLIVAIVFGAFLVRSNKNGKPLVIGDYSAMTVLTGSMEDVYPKGSLIVTKSVDSDKLKIGDDITYMTGESSSITHRIVGINDNYFDNGEKGFETQGVMNSNPDKDIVSESNIVGRVVFSSKTLGDIANFITKNWPIMLFFILVIIMLIAFLKWNSRRIIHSDEKPQDETDSNVHPLNSEKNKN